MNLDPQQAEERLNSPNNLANRFRHDSPVREIKPSDIRDSSDSLAPSEAQEIAVRARLEGTSNIAREFGVSVSKTARIAQLGGSKAVDYDAVEAKLSEVRDEAIKKTMMAIGLITDEKLSKVKATDLSSIASNMSRVIEKTMPRQEKNDGTQVNLIVYAPEVRTEKGYSVVEVKG